MIEVFLATRNQGKVEEIKEILRRISSEIGEEVVSVLPPEGDEKPPEEGKTYFENALAKAIWWREKKKIDIPIVAEDSGIEIFALSKYPGIKSAVIPHPDATDKDRCLYILKKMEGITERRARYVSCVVILTQDIWFSAEGKTYGVITDSMRGENGFGYDPIFLSDDLGKTFGEATLEEKTLVSHRWRAFEKLKKVIQNLKKTI